MQFGAWGLMIGQRSGEQSIVEAARELFLGTEPCRRCEVVGEGVEKEQSRNLDNWKIGEMRLVHLRGERIASPQRVATRPIFVLAENSASLDERSEGPPTPPPRVI